MIHLSQLAGPSFSRCSNNRPGFRAHDAVHSKIKPLLKLSHCRFCFRAEASIDPACVETNRTHPTLKAADWQAG